MLDHGLKRDRARPRRHGLAHECMSPVEDSLVWLEAWATTPEVEIYIWTRFSLATSAQLSKLALVY